MRLLNFKISSTLSLTLFLLFFVTFAYFYPGGGHNEASRIDVIKALIDDQTFIVDKYAYNSADLVRINDHYYGSKAPGSTFLGLPFFWLSEKIMSIMPFSITTRDHLTNYWTSVFSVALPCALGLMVLYWLALKLQASPRDAGLVSVAIGFGTLYFPFATLFFSHAVTATLLLVGFYQIFADRENQAWRTWLAGFCLGSAITFEYPGAIGAGLIGIYALFKRRDHPYAIARVVIAGSIALLPVLIQNWIAFGNPFFVSYEAYAQAANPTFAAHKKGLLGVSLPFLNPDDWRLFLNNFAEITYRPLRGLFFLCPILLFIFPGFALIIRRMLRREYPYPSEAILAFAMVVSYFLLDAGFGDSIVYWGGGASFGPRHVLPMIPFTVFALIECLRYRRLRIAFSPVLAISIFFCLMAVAIEPRTPYAPRNPLFEYYLPHLVKGEFALTQFGIFSNHPIVQNTVAFNWGKLAGLPAAVQLLPLFVLWIIAARDIERRTVDRERARGLIGFTYGTGLFVFIISTLAIFAAF